MKHRPSIIGFLLAFGLLAGGAYAQPTDAETPIFGEIVDVRVINLEVVVTRGKERVQGLKSGDFRLLVDGREVPIEYFTEVRGGWAVEESSGASAVPALEPGEAVGTRYLVFIDDAFTLPNQRNRVLRRLAEQLPLLGPDDHMAVVAYDGSRIDLLSSWTRSLPELERVFDEARQRRAYGLFNNRPILASDVLGFRAGTDRYFDGSFSGLAYTFDPYFPYGYGGFGYPYAGGVYRGSRAYSQAGEVIDAATSVLRGFARPPGRKVMLLLTGGWPVVADSAFSTSVEYGTWAGEDRQLLRPLIDTANRLGYTLYPVDLSGVSPPFGGAQFATAGESALVSRLMASREWVEEGALVRLARETGGRALLDGAAFQALERTVEDTRSYYWLGFTPTWRENDERHRVKVDVLPKGLKARTRKDFSDLSRQTEVTMLVESVHLFGLPMPGEGDPATAAAPLEVSFGEPQKGGFRKVVVPVKLEIPYDRVTLLPEGGADVAHLELRVAATDDRGGRADIPVIPVELRREASSHDEVAVFEFAMKLRRRPHRLLIALHDPASGEILSQRVGVDL